MVEHDERPAALEKTIRRQHIRLLRGVALLRHRGIEAGQNRGAALLRHRAIMLVAQIILRAGQQEGAQAAFLGIRGNQQIAFQQPRKEPLRKVLGIVRAFARTTKKRIERKPIGFAKRSHRMLRRDIIRAHGSPHDTPSCGLKRTRRGWRVHA